MPKILSERGILNALLDGVPVEIGGHVHMLVERGTVFTVEGNDYEATATGVFRVVHSETWEAGKKVAERKRPLVVAEDIGGLLALVREATEEECLAAAGGSALRKMAEERGRRRTTAAVESTHERQAEEDDEAVQDLPVARGNQA